jgi:glycosyltransferase involved in cell wall biosynthesis
MRLLWVKAGKLLPVDTGGKIRSYNILRHLAARHETTLLSYYDGARDEAYETELRRQFPGAVAIAVPQRSGFVHQALHYARRFPKAAPYSVSKFTSPLVMARLERLIAEWRPDVAVCDFLAASLNFPAELAVPTVLFQHNVESALWKRQARFERNLVKRAIFSIEAEKMYRYERDALGRFHHIIAVSDHDSALMSEMTPEAEITVNPTGVDVEHFRNELSTEGVDPTVMFLGSMDWPANIDGVEYFCESIWPLVLAAVPAAKFQVVGRNPPPRIRRLASDSVEIVGGVKSVLPHLHSAAVFVVPLRIGGGTRLKIYEAMAAGLPIVSTSVGAEGLDVTNGRDIVLVDEVAPFAEAVTSLLVDPRRRQEIADAAFATASRFDWSVIAGEFAAVLEKTVRVEQPA